jgi:hypothetical protein
MVTKAGTTESKQSWQQSRAAWPERPASPRASGGGERVPYSRQLPVRPCWRPGRPRPMQRWKRPPKPEHTTPKWAQPSCPGGNGGAPRAAARSGDQAPTYLAEGRREGVERRPDPVAKLGEDAGGGRSGRRQEQLGHGRRSRELRATNLICNRVRVIMCIHLNCILLLWCTYEDLYVCDLRI